MPAMRRRFGPPHRTDLDAGEDRHARERQHRCGGVVLGGRRYLEASGQGLCARLDPPVRGDRDLDPTEQRVDGELGLCGKLGIAQIDFDPAVPGQHRAAPEGRGAAHELYAVEHRDERELVTLLVSA